jgi:hypothetical protein
MQTLKDSVCSDSCCFVVCHKASGRRRDGSLGDNDWAPGLDTPKPGQDVHSKHSNTGTGCNTSKGLFCTRFSMRETVSTDHDSDQTGNFRDGAGKQCLNCGKASVERRLSFGNARKEEDAQPERRKTLKQYPNPSVLTMRNYFSESFLHLAPPATEESVGDERKLSRSPTGCPIMFGAMAIPISNEQEVHGPSDRHTSAGRGTKK